MNEIVVLSSSLMLVGAVFMAAAIIHGRKIRADVPAELQWKWRILISFTIFFLVGYVLFAAVLLGNIKLPQELVTSPIFFVGAIFVFMVVSLTHSTIGRMKEAEENLRLLNESLELKVAERNRELMTVQEELLRREKLAMLDIVAGNVGNELRNPLGVMRNAVYYLNLRLTDADQSIREYLEIIRTEIDGSQRILADFVDFFRSGPPRKRKILVAELIRQSLAGCTVPENVTVNMELPETLPVIEIDPARCGRFFRISSPMRCRQCRREASCGSLRGDGLSPTRGRANTLYRPTRAG